MDRRGEERVVLALELVLLVALLVALVIANAKLFRVLERIGVAWTKGLPPTAVFVAAAWLAVRRARRVASRLRATGARNGGSDDRS